MVRRMLFVFVLMFLVSSCATTRDMTINQNTNTPPRIKVVHKQSGGMVVYVSAVDGRYVSKDDTYIAIDPGWHIIDVDFEKKISTGGLPISIRVNIFGASNEVNSGGKSFTASSKHPKRIRFHFERGERYIVVATDNLEIGEIENSLTRMCAATKQYYPGGRDCPKLYGIRGDWHPRILKQ